MKSFRHKTLGWTAEPARDDDVRLKELLTDKYDIFAFPDASYINNHRMTAEELIALGFEEVVEKDWKEECVDEIFAYFRGRPGDDPNYISIRKIIEKHAPKQKVFTESEVFERVQNNKDDTCPPSGWITYFLKKHGLLSSYE